MAMIYLGSVDEETDSVGSGSAGGSDSSGGRDSSGAGTGSGSGECSCIAPPCPCDMRVVYDPSQCPVGTKAEIIRSGPSEAGTSTITVTQYRCVPTSFIGRLGIEPKWLLIGAIAVGALLMFGGGGKGGD